MRLGFPGGNGALYSQLPALRPGPCRTHSSIPLPELRKGHRPAGRRRSAPCSRSSPPSHPGETSTPIIPRHRSSTTVAAASSRLPTTGRQFGISSQAGAEGRGSRYYPQPSACTGGVGAVDWLPACAARARIPLSPRAGLVRRICSLARRAATETCCRTPVSRRPTLSRAFRLSWRCAYRGRSGPRARPTHCSRARVGVSLRAGCVGEFAVPRTAGDP